MKHVKLAAMVVALAASACARAEPGATAPPQNRAEIEAVIKAYLLEHPEVITEALAEKDRREKANTFAEMVSTTSSPTLGPDNAKITIVEFFDYNCGYCKRSSNWVVSLAESQSKDIRVIFKELPILENGSGSSTNAAKAALASARQGRYRDMHLALMKSSDLSIEGIEKAARAAGVNVERLRKDMADPKLMDALATNFGLAERAGVQGTPGFFINGDFVPGFDKDQIEALISQHRES